MKEFTVQYKYRYTPAPDFGETALHTHRQYEILHLISGNADLLLRGERIPLFPDALLLIPKGAEHHIHLLDPAPFTRAVINFENLPSEIADELFSRPRVLQIEEDQRIKRVLETMRDYSEYFDRETRTLSLALSTMELMLLLQKSALKETPAAQYGFFMEWALRHIEKHLAEIEDIAHLCRALHISRAQLYREFNGAMGISPKQYINQKRLQAARELLLLGEEATRVAERCGWRDYSTFYRAYRREFACSPARAKQGEKSK